MNNSLVAATQGGMLFRLQQTISKVSNLSNYAPYSTDDSLAALQQLRSRLEEVNNSFALAESEYSLATKNREAAYKEDEYSVDKLLKHIRGVIAYNHGRKSHEVEIVAAFIRKIRNASLVDNSQKEEENVGDKTDAAAEDAMLEDAAAQEAAAIAEEGEEEEDEEAEEPTKKKRKKTNHSERSYPAMLFNFRSLLEKISTMRYTPNRSEMRLPDLRDFALRLDEMNGDVIMKLDKMNALRHQRNELTADADASIRRIKDFVRLEYGVKSAAYQALRRV